MEEQDWKNIIDELTDQIKQISIERALARADVRKAGPLLEEQRARINELEAELASLNSAEVHKITTKK